MSSAVSQPHQYFVVQVTKDHDDFDVAGLGPQASALFTLPADSRILSASLECTEAPVGCTTYQIDIGDAATQTGYVVGADMVAGGIGVYETLGAYLTTTGRTVTAATAVNAYATSTVDNLDQASAGEWTFRISYVRFYA